MLGAVMTDKLDMSRDRFVWELEALISEAERAKKTYLDVKSGDLHAIVGGYPSKTNHRMPTCCAVMRQYMTLKDEVLSEPVFEKDATLLIRYKLPRSAS